MKLSGGSMYAAAGLSRPARAHATELHGIHELERAFVRLMKLLS